MRRKFLAMLFFSFVSASGFGQSKYEVVLPSDLPDDVRQILPKIGVDLRKDPKLAEYRGVFVPNPQTLAIMTLLQAGYNFRFTPEPIDPDLGDYLPAANGVLGQIIPKDGPVPERRGDDWLGIAGSPDFGFDMKKLAKFLNIPSNSTGTYFGKQSSTPVSVSLRVYEELADEIFMTTVADNGRKQSWRQSATTHKFEAQPFFFRFRFGPVEPVAEISTEPGWRIYDLAVVQTPAGFAILSSGLVSNTVAPVGFQSSVWRAIGDDEEANLADYFNKRIQARIEELAMRIQVGG